MVDDKVNGCLMTVEQWFMVVHDDGLYIVFSSCAAITNLIGADDDQ